MVYITLWYIGNQCTHREISLLFNRSVSTIWRSVNQCTKIIELQLQHFIKWPTGEEAPLIADEFQHVAGFPGVIEAMDGTHIEIVSPSENQKDFNNRKMRHSLILLAVCLPNRSFSYTYAGFPGSANDARVFRCSDLGVAIYEEPTLLFPGSQYHVLADSAFPCTPHVMPSIKASLATTKKKNCNAILSKTRILIEHAFGDIKNTFRRLHYIYAHVEKAVRIISCCCALHNFLISRGERIVTYQLPEDIEHEDINEIADDWFSLQSGVAKRNEIIDILHDNVVLNPDIEHD